MVDSKRIRKEARNDLSGYRASAAIRELLYFLLGFGGGAFPCLLLFVAQVIIFVMMVSGITWFRLSLETLNKVFIWMWAAVVVMILRTLIGAWIKLANLMYYDSVMYDRRVRPTFAASVTHVLGQITIDAWRMVGTLLLFPFGIVPAIWFSSVYSCADFFYAQEPGDGARAALRRSRQLMCGYKRKVVALWFSFFGWFLLCVITCGIACLYVVPYYQTAKAEFLFCAYEEKHQNDPMPQKANSLDYYYNGMLHLP